MSTNSCYPIPSETLFLDNESWEQLIEIMEAPITVNENLKEVIAEYKKRMGSIEKQIETERLILREWRPEDVPYFAAINQDPKVMEYFLKPLTEAETAAMVESIQKHFKEHSFGVFACILKETSNCIGFVGLNVPDFTASFTPCVEIGWRLASHAWGKGYATEAAREVLRYGFEKLNLEEIVSFAVSSNARSIRVMEKIGMKRDLKGDFNHPKVPDGHPIKAHVLYRITRYS